MQAIEYGCMGYFPNGTHPVAALFVTIDSKLVDFNIHPAKKEVRFKDSSELHHSVSTTTASFFKNSTIKSLKPELDSTYYENTFNRELFESPLSDSGNNGSYSASSPLSDAGSASYSGESGLSRYERLNAPTSRNSFNSIEEKSYNSDLRSVFMNNTGSSYASKLAQMASEQDSPVPSSSSQ